ncbi:hypothetical protein ACXYUI_30760, partial [Klebsiella pneumoniae]
CAWFGGTAVGVFTAATLIVATPIMLQSPAAFHEDSTRFFLTRMAYHSLEWTLIAVLCGGFRKVHTAETASRSALQQEMAVREV